MMQHINQSSTVWKKLYELYKDNNNLVTINNSTIKTKWISQCYESENKYFCESKKQR